MKKERQRRTEATIAQGNAQAVKITTDAESMKTELLAAAEARAKTIRGEGDAEAAQYYKMLEANSGLAIYLRNIESLLKTLKEGTTLVISADSEPFELLKEIPDIETRKQSQK